GPFPAPRYPPRRRVARPRAAPVPGVLRQRGVRSARYVLTREHPPTPRKNLRPARPRRETAARRAARGHAPATRDQATPSEITPTPAPPTRGRGAARHPRAAPQGSRSRIPPPPCGEGAGVGVSGGGTPG